MGFVEEEFDTACAMVRWTISTISQVLLNPVIFLLLLFVLSKAYLSVQTSGVPHPPSSSLNSYALAPCQGRVPDDLNCINLMFTPDTPTVRGILSNFLTAHTLRSGYSLSIDSVPSSFYTDLPPPQSNLGFIPVPSSDFIYNYVLKYPNSTLLGLSFNITDTTYKYEVWYNASLFAGTEISDFLGPPLLYFERTLEEAIFNSSGNNASFDVSLRPFPTLPLLRVHDSLSASLGPSLFFIITALPTVLMAMNALVGEKENQLRRYMMLMGLRRESWYASWYLTFSLISAVLAILLALFGKAFQFEFFTNSNFGVMFFTFWLHSMAELSLSFFAIVWIRHTSSAVLFATFWYILGLLFMFVVFSNEYLAYVWWSPETPSALKSIFIFLPYFNFGAMLAGISTLSIGDVNALSQEYVPPPGFSWSDLYKNIPHDLLTTDSNPPPPVQSWYWLLMNMVLFLVLAWYLDSVLPDEFGVRQKYLFFLDREYWGYKRDTGKHDLSAWLQDIQRNHAEKVKQFEGKGRNRVNPEAATEETSPTIDDDNELSQLRDASFDISTPAGLRVACLRKTFGDDCVAISNSSFVMKYGELLAIVGANGSGKSTTCNVLCGVTPADAGDALLDEKYSLLKRRPGGSLVGWCPQHDILFDDLTPIEHIMLYAAISGVSKARAQTLAEERLKRVRLWRRKDCRVGTFSGGMRRRLSMVLSTVSDPKLLILDEVTTGLDPIGTRHCWDFIQHFKEGRLIMLVTHSMEEAELLADNVIVMQKGNIVAAGTPLRLKAKYGKGYRLTLASLSQPAQTKPPGDSAALESCAAGEVVWRIEDVGELGNVVRWAEEVEHGSRLPDQSKEITIDKESQIQGWEISMPTLEDVLLEKKLF